MNGSPWDQSYQYASREPRNQGQPAGQMAYGSYGVSTKGRPSNLPILIHWQSHSHPQPQHTTEMSKTNKSKQSSYPWTRVSIKIFHLVSLFSLLAHPFFLRPFPLFSSFFTLSVFIMSKLNWLSLSLQLTKGRWEALIHIC